jgi:hypothetical protein
MNRLILNRWGRRAANRLAFTSMIVSALLIVVATLAPRRWELGPITISLRSVRNPLIGLVAGYLVWRLTFDGYGQWLKCRLDRLKGFDSQPGEHLQRAAGRFRTLWAQWGWRQRGMLLAVVAQTFFALRSWQNYPWHLEYDRQAQLNSDQTAAVDSRGERLPVVESFARRVCEQLPPDARILFHGRMPAMPFAYEVYPRPVFMLPQEMRRLAASWHVQPPFRDLGDDPHEPYWHQFLPIAETDPTTFIHRHGITHVVTFDDYDLSLCRVEPVQ